MDKGRSPYSPRHESFEPPARQRSVIEFILGVIIGKRGWEWSMGSVYPDGFTGTHISKAWKVAYRETEAIVYDRV